jgi:mannose-1-phosphate guanylyltransferase/mannose-6-phosphate isomerase
MEKTKRAAVAPCAIGWADVGSWSEIWRLGDQDAAGNALQGAAAALDAHNNLVRGDGVKVCVAGVSDLIVIATPEGVIVLPRARAQDVKTLRDLAQKLT